MGTEEKYVNFSFDVLNSVPTDTGVLPVTIKLPGYPN